MQPGTEEQLLRRQIEQLEQELGQLRMQSRKVAEANARAALDAAERHQQLELQGKKLEQALKEARTAARRKDEFVAKVSHELRTPLNAVLGMSQLLGDTELTSLQSELVKTTAEAARSLRELIEDLLDFSRLNATHLRLSCTSIDCWEVCEEAVALLKYQAAEKGLSVQLHIAADAPRFLDGDATRLRQVLVNLLGNAVKFTSAGGVALRLTAGDDLVLFQVADTGPGIPESDLDRIFQPFEQGDNSASRSFEGTGLGLAISSGLASAMGGRLEATSRLGEGSTFTLSLPGGVEDTDEQARKRAFDRSILLTNDPALRQQHLDHVQAIGIEALTPETVDELTAAPGTGSSRDLVILDLCSMDEQVAARAIERLGADAPDTRLARILPTGSEGLEVGADLPTLRAPLRVTRLHRLLQDGELEVQRDRDPAPQLAPAPLPLKGVRALLVEDNLINQRVAQMMLKKLGCLVEVCSGGEEAIDAFQRQRPDVVLMDCQMPGIDGYAATRRLRELEEGGARTPIIALTAHVAPADRSSCTEAGMDDHLSKPIEAEQLRATLVHWIEAAGQDPVS